MQLKPWRYVAGWKCIKCAKCCSELDVAVTPDEERRLEKYGDVFKKGKVLVYLKKIGGKCVFLDGSRCKVYGERPMACVKYPFYFKSAGNNESLFDLGIHVYVDLSCPGVEVAETPRFAGSVARRIKSLLRNEKLIIV